MTLSRTDAEYIAYIVLLIRPPPRHGVFQVQPCRAFATSHKNWKTPSDVYMQRYFAFNAPDAYESRNVAAAKDKSWDERITSEEPRMNQPDDGQGKEEDEAEMTGRQLWRCTTFFVDFDYD